MLSIYTSLHIKRVFHVMNAQAYETMKILWNESTIVCGVDDLVSWKFEVVGIIL